MNVVLSELTDQSAPAAADLENLFNAMYEHFAACAGRPFLRPGGFSNWIGSYEKVRGRSRTICLAHHGATLVGFAEGLLKAPPAYYEPGLIGFVAHAFVHPDWRNKGVAHDLYGRLKAWFAEQNVAAIELQVVHGNDSAARFWQSLGFRADNTQLRSPLV